ncbi:hypothetical protein [Cytobacillus firmus]|uniref:hypothetical protein n=1 Tax=Cytobacillus firmus TaxID=1399 RepID=UPI002030138C|nr:hypothetical protein [Cytobacillus firmus]URT69097.1 hypothetical protein NAF01_14925 [Cytobacillus firmus]
MLEMGMRGEGRILIVMAVYVDQKAGTCRKMVVNQKAGEKAGGDYKMVVNQEE